LDVHDVHKDSVSACAVLFDGEGGRQERRKDFPTHVCGLGRLNGWLTALRVTHIAIAMSDIEYRLCCGMDFHKDTVNPAQVKALQGRQSDGRDAKRIAEFLQDGRFDPSVVPTKPMRELRQMLRHASACSSSAARRITRSGTCSKRPTSS
jgi:hypothetical protein